jgi:uncharacterized protein (TIGR02145 family)
LYYVRAYATNSAGTGYGNQVSFTTSQIALATLTTTAITSITQTTAVSGGNITDDKGGSVTARGVCWSTATNPTTANNKTTDGTGTGSFLSNLTGLIGNTTYYVRAYATNSVGTAYGNEVSFKTGPVMPTLSTTTISSISQTTATSGGNITSDGGVAVTARGVCWSTSANPTPSINSRTKDGTGTGVFTSSITDLIPNNIYYIRAYATNSIGTGYGNTVTFSVQMNPIIFNPNLTYGTVTDIDGNVYKTITIGTQTWMAENLKTTKYSDGIPVPLANTESTWYNLTTASKAYCWYEDNIGSKDLCGAYYTWAAAMNGAASSNTKPSGVQGVCPTGWHLPSSTEFTTLNTYLGGTSAAGGKLKEIGTTHWNTPNIGATNGSGFTALPSGLRNIGGSFYYGIGNSCYWWCSTESSSYLNANAWFLSWDTSQSTYGYSDKKNGMSVRCVKD